MNLAADFLTANGFSEIMSNSLTKGAYYEGLQTCPASRCVRIMNPLSADLNVMRQTLLFNMMEAVQLNANRRNGDLKLYEFGNCYFYDDARSGGENGLAPYSENYRLAIAVTGIDRPQNWDEKARPASFFTLRAVAEKLLRRFGIDIYALQAEPMKNELFSEGLSFAQIGKELLRIGVVSPAVRRMTDVKQEVYFLEAEFDLLVKATRKHRIAAEELSKFPEVKRDLALLVDRGQDAHARRQDHRTRDGRPDGAVRTQVRRAGARMIPAAAVSDDREAGSAGFAPVSPAFVVSFGAVSGIGGACAGSGEPDALPCSPPGGLRTKSGARPIGSPQ